MIRVVACEPELPPLEVFKSFKYRDKDGFFNLVLKVRHRGRCQHLAKKEDREPPATLAKQVLKGRVEVRRVEYLGTSHALDQFGSFALGNIENFVDRDDAEHVHVGVDNR